MSELLDRILPEHVIDASTSRARQFEQHYGFLRRPARLRLRFLDQAHDIAGLRDIEVLVNQFQTLSLPVDTVYVVENDVPPWRFQTCRRPLWSSGWAMASASNWPTRAG
ncbi:Wadjet anti-phage system protein JetD domain-containing protein [Marinobacter sp. AC-23]|uniref:Wadjet anti-phage system protein JetD domain-containing protein n=1 Tax=Marinobacter sp. AC-23 TaxID=1879031 RepID=UPI0009F5F854